jgi:hypothetical protein
MDHLKLILAFILLLLFILTFFYFFKENEIDGIMFLKKEQTRDHLLADKDQYINNMTKIDLFARKVNTKEEYFYIIEKCCRDFTKKEKKKLLKCCKKADKFLSEYEYKGIDCKKISKIKWKFAGTQNYKQYEYENGFPHTRGDIIFLSNKTINDIISSNENDENLTATLIHEKVHIYQKQNKEEMRTYLEKSGYIECKEKIENKRSNPDTDQKIYKDPVSKECMVFTYRSSKPKHINDVVQKDFSQEHPYEKMAYEIANGFSMITMRKFKDIII